MKNYNNFPTLSLKGYLVWGLAAIFYAYEFILRVSPSVIIENLILDFSSLNLSKAHLGNISAFYFYAYALTQVPAGILCDKWGVRPLLTLACLCTAIGTFLFAHGHNLETAYISRLIIGAGSAFAFVSCLSLAKNWIPPKQFPIIVGLTNAFGMLGAIMGNEPLAILVNYAGWREAFDYLGIAGLILTVVLWYYIPNRTRVISTAPIKKKTNTLSLKTALSNKKTWLLALYGCLLVAPIATFGELWGVAFFQVRFNIPKEVASSLISWIFIGIALGGPLIGFVASKIHNYKLIMFTSTTIALCALLTIIYYPSLSLTQVCTLLFLYGLFTSNMLLCFSLIATYHPNNSHSTAIGFTNMMIMAGGAAFQPVVGLLLDSRQKHSTTLETILPNLGDFQSALNILPFCLAIALGLLSLSFLLKRFN